MEQKYLTWRQTYIRSSPQGLYCFYNAKVCTQAERTTTEELIGYPHQQGDNGDAITCSEAHGYAMLIAILHRNLPEFDALLHFFLAFRNQSGLMKWQIRQGVSLYVAEDGETSATDGGEISSSVRL